jgi:hypothetical protein
MGDLGLERSERRGLSSFLAEHEGCDEGFDIQRRQGQEASMVRVICNGCGEAIEYPAAPTSRARANGAAAEVTRRERRIERRRFTSSATEVSEAAPPMALDPDEALTADNGGTLAGPPPPHQEARISSWPNWLSIALITALIGGGLVMIAVGLFNSDDNGSVAGAPAGQAASASSGEAAQWQTAPPTTTAAQKAAPAVQLSNRQFADRVSVGVPRGWSAGVSGGAVTVAAGDGGAQVQVYYEAGARPAGELGQRTRDFMAQRHPGARIEGPRTTQRAGAPAQLIRALYDGGTESAWAFTSGGYTYLNLERVEQGTSRHDRRQADAVVASVRPL